MEPGYEISIPQIPDQPTQIPVLTMHDNALHLCAARIH